MPHHRPEPPPSALARGCTKTTDIEIARRGLGRAQVSAVRELRAAADRHQLQVALREREERGEPEQPAAS